MSKDTLFQVYRQHKPEQEVIDLTVFYREPDRAKVRIDAVIDEKVLMSTNNDTLGPEHVRIVQWGSAATMIRTDEK